MQDLKSCAHYNTNAATSRGRVMRSLFLLNLVHLDVVAHALDAVPEDLLEPPPIAIDHVVLRLPVHVPAVELERLAVADERLEVLRLPRGLLGLV